ncbi:uncharacterized protein O3C94_021061 [Discoglossus pictus]
MWGPAMFGGPLDVKPPVVSKVEQEDLNIRDQQQVKEEESPGSIREGPQDGDLYPDLINEDGEYERDEKSIHQMETHSDPCTADGSEIWSNIGEDHICNTGEKPFPCSECASHLVLGSTGIFYGLDSPNSTVYGFSHLFWGAGILYVDSFTLLGTVAILHATSLGVLLPLLTALI